MDSSKDTIKPGGFYTVTPHTASFKSPTKFIHENVKDITVLTQCSKLEEYKKLIAAEASNNVGILQQIQSDNEKFRVARTVGFADSLKTPLVVGVNDAAQNLINAYNGAVPVFNDYLSKVCNRLKLQKEQYGKEYLEIAKINLHIKALELGIERNHQKMALFEKLSEVATVTKNGSLQIFYTNQNRRLGNELKTLHMYLKQLKIDLAAQHEIIS